MATTEVVSKALPTAEGREVLDTRGLLCPYPFIRAKELLEGLPAGSIVEVLTDSEPTATASIPILCAQNGYTYECAQDGEEWRLVVRKP